MEALALFDDVTIPVEAERSHVAKLCGFVFGTCLDSVEVFHPHQKWAPVGARRQPRHDRCTQVSKMQLTRWRWSKPPSHVPIMARAATQYVTAAECTRHYLGPYLLHKRLM